MRNSRGQFIAGALSGLTPIQVAKKRASLKISWKQRADYHGMYGTRFYNTWRSMKNRCDGTGSKEANAKYNKRGIRYNRAWSNFSAFYNDMFSSYRDGLQLDRINNDLGYSKENCRWATSKENNNNRRNNVIIEYLGKRLTLSQWADELKIPVTALRIRYFRYYSKGKYGIDKLFRNGKAEKGRKEGKDIY